MGLLLRQGWKRLQESSRLAAQRETKVSPGSEDGGKRSGAGGKSKTWEGVPGKETENIWGTEIWW